MNTRALLNSGLDKINFDNDTSVIKYYFLNQGFSKNKQRNSNFKQIPNSQSRNINNISADRFSEEISKSVNLRKGFDGDFIQPTNTRMFNYQRFDDYVPVSSKKIISRNSYNVSNSYQFDEGNRSVLDHSKIKISPKRLNNINSEAQYYISQKPFDRIINDSYNKPSNILVHVSNKHIFNMMLWFL